MSSEAVSLTRSLTGLRELGQQLRVDSIRASDVPMPLATPRPLCDAQYAHTRAVADHMFVNYAGVIPADCDIGEKRAYDPRSWGRDAEQAMAAQVSWRPAANSAPRVGASPAVDGRLD